MNEIVQWAVIAFLGILTLGAFRQIGTISPRKSSQAISGPQLGRRIPKILSSRLPVTAGELTTLAFVTENCLGCQQLVASLEGKPANASGKRDVVIVAKNPSPAYLRALANLEVAVIPDADGNIWKALNVTATPLVVKVDAQQKIVESEVTHSVN